MNDIIKLKDVEEYLFKGRKFIVKENDLKEVSNSFNFLKGFSKEKIIYGINTGFGPMAQYNVEEKDLLELQYNLIKSHATGMGKPLEGVYSRSVVLMRLLTFLQGHSAVSREVIDTLVFIFNSEIYPEIPEHGGVGASGDLVQLAHLGLNLIGEGKVNFKGKRIDSKIAFQENEKNPHKLQQRDGLAILNGTSCMTGIASINLIFSKRLLNWAIVSSSILNEITQSFDDSYSEELNSVKSHPGQIEIAQSMRKFLVNSKLIKKRKELFEDKNELTRDYYENKIQSQYSIRCAPQILGPILDTINYAIEVVQNEMNSASDNPIISTEKQNVFHGGNFHGDYISLEMDKLKLVITKLTMLMERQLNILLNDTLNDRFPPFLNAGKLGFNFGYQGFQYTATSTTSESQTLSTSSYIHSIPSNNENQDIVSMGTNSALLAKKIIDNSFQVMAIQLSALCQAIDLLPGLEKSKLADSTIRVNDLVRNHIPFIVNDTVQYESLQSLKEYISQNNFEI